MDNMDLHYRSFKSESIFISIVVEAEGEVECSVAAIIQEGKGGVGFSW